MQTKLNQLCQIEGFDAPNELLEAYIFDSVCPAICTEPGCDFVVEMEPDQDHGFCEECGKQSVKSAFILMEII